MFWRKWVKNIRTIFYSDKRTSGRVILYLFLGSTHVLLESLSESNDQEVWEFARENEYTKRKL